MTESLKELYYICKELFRYIFTSYYYFVCVCYVFQEDEAIHVQVRGSVRVKHSGREGHL